MTISHVCTLSILYNPMLGWQIFEQKSNKEFASCKKHARASRKRTYEYKNSSFLYSCCDYCCCYLSFLPLLFLSLLFCCFMIFLLQSANARGNSKLEIRQIEFRLFAFEAYNANFHMCLRIHRYDDISNYIPRKLSDPGS